MVPNTRPTNQETQLSAVSPRWRQTERGQVFGTASTPSSRFPPGRHAFSVCPSGATPLRPCGRKPIRRRERSPTETPRMRHGPSSARPGALYNTEQGAPPAPVLLFRPRGAKAKPNARVPSRREPTDIYIYII